MIRHLAAAARLSLTRAPQMALWLVTAGFMIHNAAADHCTAPLPVKGTAFTGTIEVVLDADSFCLWNDTGLVEVRVADFYGVELREPGGYEARQQAAAVLLGKQASCVARNRSYDRVVADCAVDGRIVADLLREAGIKEGGQGYNPQ